MVTRLSSARPLFRFRGKAGEAPLTPCGLVLTTKVGVPNGERADERRWIIYGDMCMAFPQPEPYVALLLWLLI